MTVRKGHWAGGSQVLELALAPGRYEEWLEKVFDGLEEDRKKACIEKWLRIRDWHLAERMVWRALDRWRSMRTSHGQRKAIDRLRKVYEERCEKFAVAEEAHFKASHFMTKKIRRTMSREVYEMIVGHPGWFPPRTK